MAKHDEIEYLKTLARVDNKSIEDINRYHLQKPWSNTDPARYIMDIGQILNLLPPPPAKLLDIGVGSGWTSRIFAQVGYTVHGIDISPDMIALAQESCVGLDNIEFSVVDMEDFLVGEFDCAVIYEALHHADNPSKVLKSIYRNLRKEGTLITVEPGRGHEKGCREITKKYGTTEKDMEPLFQRYLMRSAGFGNVRQFIRLHNLVLSDVSNKFDLKNQSIVFNGLLYNIENTGISCIMSAQRLQEDEEYPTYETFQDVSEVERQSPYFSHELFERYKKLKNSKWRKLGMYLGLTRKHSNWDE